MGVNLYQSFYQKDQIQFLNDGCIPFDNTRNENPELREYPLFKKIYEIEKDNGGLWGLISFRFKEKTLLEPKEFKEWIEQNPGYDVYYIDPFLDVSVSYPNLWVQGEQWHPGIYEFFKHLVGASADGLVYHPDDFVTCNFFVGNRKFWMGYFSFVEHILYLAETNDTLKYYLYQKEIHYNGKTITYFSFIIERLLSLYFHYIRDVNKKKFPIEHDCFKQKYGDMHQHLVNAYKSRL